MLPGIFIPSLTVGGAWGRLIGMLVQACLTSAGSSLRISLPAYTSVCHLIYTPVLAEHIISGSRSYSCSRVCIECGHGLSRHVYAKLSQCRT